MHHLRTKKKNLHTRAYDDHLIIINSFIEGAEDVIKRQIYQE